MAAKCSGIPGAVCTNNVLFRVHKDAIETDTGRIDCDLSAALGELERSGGRYGLVTMCAAGGMAPAIIIERI